MTTETPGGRGGHGVRLQLPWSRRTWLDTMHLVVGCPVGLATGVVVLTLVTVSAALAVTVVPAVAVLAVLFGFVEMCTRWQRSRFAAFQGVRLAPFPPPAEASGWWDRLADRIGSSRVWRQLGYHLVSGLTTMAGGAAVLACWVFGLVLATLPVSAWLAPHRGELRLYLPNGAMAAVVLAVFGLVLVFLAPWIAGGMAALDLAMARVLLQPSRGEQLARQVASLSASRAGAVDAADAERRRIERDLHDGTQQRLVSLAMNLGMTRAAMTDAAPEVREAIAAAHEEAKRALSELRDFVRGLHPAVLDELGLDAALSGIAARSPVPVTLTVELPERPPAAVEAVAYFVVSEALTNTAKHAGASRIEVQVRRPSPDRLVLAVTDDGRGGADPARGTGLRGLRQRVASVDGTLRIDSPPGGPTLILVELPCVS